MVMKGFSFSLSRPPATSAHISMVLRQLTAFWASAMKCLEVCSSSCLVSHKSTVAGGTSVGVAGTRM